MFYRLAPQLVIRSAWRPYRSRPGDRVLTLRSGTAFPPSHSTTQLCLELLAAAQMEKPAGQVHWLQGSTEALRGHFELVVANLPWTVHMAKVMELQRLTYPQGRLILSGFRETQEQTLLTLYLNQGWQLHRRATLDRWEIELPAERSYTWVGLTLGYQ
ncbi:MAG: hypothetical protein BZ151_04985 [Desulfobacca sp. 4484_104]|nr:MAG: hypothetical protein BZ151_04985 [Desulfobacca sp. 4484_104]